MKMLFFGSLVWGTTTLARLDGMRKFVEHIYGVDSGNVIGEYVTRGRWIRFQLRLGRGPVVRRLSARLVSEAQRYRPDMVWVEQGNGIRGEALSEVRRMGAFCVHYTVDSLHGLGFDSACFLNSLPEYDLCITTKPDEPDLYRRRGARRVFMSLHGYDPNIHRPVALDAADRAKYECDVTFIGQRMAARADSLMTLLARVPCRVNLYGRQWEKGPTGRRLGPLQKGWIYGDAYAKAICGAKICLAFLNREVGDYYTNRTFEIPACGGLMLAERTDIHRELFEEDKEAVFFWKRRRTRR